MIRYLKHSEINTELWDQCVDSACNSRVYGMSWYLNALCRHSWDALVLGNYEAVMPLPWNRKYGLKYVYQPPFTQQLGVFAPNATYLNDFNHWLAAIPKTFVLCDIKGNEAMLMAQPNLLCRQRTNLILSLNKDYPSLFAGFQARLRNQIRSLKPELNLNTMDPKLALKFFRLHQGYRDQTLKSADYDALLKLMTERPESFITRQATYNNQCIGMISLLKEDSRLSLILNAPNEEGRKHNSQSFLIDSIIREFAGTPTLLDFEGSDFPSTEHFYRKFGSENRPYPQLRYVPFRPLAKLLTLMV